MQPLTQLPPDELLFRYTVRDFARNEIEQQAFDPKLLKKLHALGLMGIQVPEDYGGAAGTLFRGCAGLSR